MKTTARGSVTTELSGLSDEELTFLSQRTWGVNVRSDATLLDALARRGIRPASMIWLTMALNWERDAREERREQ